MPGLREPATGWDGPLPRVPPHTRRMAGVICAGGALGLMLAYTVWLARRIHRETNGPPIPLKPEGEEPQ